MSTPVLDVRGLSYDIGATPILRDVSFSVAAGDYVSVIGPNGAGKTTLLKCLNRILPGGRGEIAVRGRPLKDCSQAELAQEMAYVPQAEGRHFDFTVFEFVLMARYPYLSPFSAVKPDDVAVVWHALETTGIRGFSERIHGTLSGGERQKVFIAAAIAQRAPLLLLDEATTFLDPYHEQEILDILHRVHQEEGVAVLSVTHDINSAVLTSDRVIALRMGEIVFAGAPGELMEPGTLQSIFGKPFTFTHHPVTQQRMVLPDALNAGQGKREGE
ncbi:MAG: ABC transporter ATP-binding protein [Lentisphaerae bacterium]|jgi:iron complex transport system ATP-binding protein|nr:ABC transporter ATP-binding protein [Lentisphaerota bacterium]MBT4823149.1 ABC transporter ATP-binding protein [Lentisphaerota bacterium]MBT5610463.1 ABC transporter ATP-binding protein [Lentisphaerota bacterium]MBT7061054.1 ABC transporter ATP-binding protein [Lentisphaerota bacterium]MBT7842161.1 ABC transporter ATP-binding protein [Lentisphaerota bacterium]